MSKFKSFLAVLVFCALSFLSATGQTAIDDVGLHPLATLSGNGNETIDLSSLGITVVSPIFRRSSPTLPVTYDWLMRPNGVPGIDISGQEFPHVVNAQQWYPPYNIGAALLVGQIGTSGQCFSPNPGFPPCNPTSVGGIAYRDSSGALHPFALAPALTNAGDHFQTTASDGSGYVLIGDRDVYNPAGTGSAFDFFTLYDAAGDLLIPKSPVQNALNFLTPPWPGGCVYNGAQFIDSHGNMEEARVNAGAPSCSGYPQGTSALVGSATPNFSQTLWGTVSDNQITWHDVQIGYNTIRTIYDNNGNFAVRTVPTNQISPITIKDALGTTAAVETLSGSGPQDSPLKPTSTVQPHKIAYTDGTGTSQSFTTSGDWFQFSMPQIQTWDAWNPDQGSCQLPGAPPNTDGALYALANSWLPATAGFYRGGSHYYSNMPWFYLPTSINSPDGSAMNVTYEETPDIPAGSGNIRGISVSAPDRVGYSTVTVTLDNYPTNIGENFENYVNTPPITFSGLTTAPWLNGVTLWGYELGAPDNPTGVLSRMPTINQNLPSFPLSSGWRITGSWYNPTSGNKTVGTVAETGISSWATVKGSAPLLHVTGINQSQSLVIITFSATDSFPSARMPLTISGLTHATEWNGRVITGYSIAGNQILLGGTTSYSGAETGTITGGSTYTGRVASMQYATGGTVSYAYSGGRFNTGYNCDGTYNTVIRTTADGSTSYTHTPPTGFIMPANASGYIMEPGDKWLFQQAPVLFGLGVYDTLNQPTPVHPYLMDGFVYNGWDQLNGLGFLLESDGNAQPQTPTTIGGESVSLPYHGIVRVIVSDSLTNNVVTFNSPNTATLVAGQTYHIYNSVNLAFLNNVNFTITGVTPNSFTASYTHANVALNTDTALALSPYGAPQNAGFQYDEPHAKIYYGNPVSTTTITSNNGDVTVMTFAGSYTIKEQVYQGTAVPAHLLLTKVYCYNGNTANCDTLPYPVSSTITQRDVYTTIPGVSGASVLSTRFDQFGQTIESKRYDFGKSGNQFISDAQTVYGSYNHTTGACDPVNTIISNRVCKSTASDPTGILAEERYSYDAKGNTTQHDRVILQSATTDTSTAPVLTFKFTYNTNGTVASITDANGSPETFTYGACNGLMVTSVQRPGTSPENIGWNCATATSTSMTDVNGRTWTSTYNDPLLRVTSATDPMTTVAYPSGINFVYAPNGIQSTSTPNGGVSTTAVTLDAYGRPFKNQTQYDGTNYSTTETDYNAMGQAYRQTVPYPGLIAFNSNAVDQNTPATVTLFDALGRKTKITNPRNGTITYTYPANDMITTVSAPTGEAKKITQTEFDGFGRVTSVCEVSTQPGSAPCNQTTAASGFRTDYFYDALDRPTVIQSGVQARSTIYDSLGRITNTANPETSFSSYFDSSSAGDCASNPGENIASLDGLGTRKCYNYDNSRRMVVSTPSNLSAATADDTKVMVYDTTPPSPFTCSQGDNSKTRLVRSSTTDASTYKLKLVASPGNISGSATLSATLSLNGGGTLAFTTGAIITGTGTIATGVNFSSGGTVTITGAPGVPNFSGSFYGTLSWIQHKSGSNTVFLLSGTVLGADGSAGYFSVQTVSLGAWPTNFSGSASLAPFSGGLTNVGVGPRLTDNVYCYTPRGEVSDSYQLLPGSTQYVHLTKTYYENGVLKTLSGMTGFAPITFNMDGFSQITSISTTTGGQNPVTATQYNIAHLPTSITFGSTDKDTYTYDTSFEPNVYSHLVHGSIAEKEDLTWNTNGSIKSLNITDNFNSVNSQLCQYTHDDLSRIASVDCGADWKQNFTYDRYGNITKTVPGGSPGYSFQPTYDVNTNRVTSIVGVGTPQYNGNGDMTFDGSNNYTYNSDHTPASVNSAGNLYDAMGNLVKSGTVSYVWEEGNPILAFDASFNVLWGQIVLQHDNRAVYVNSGGTMVLDHYLRKDWLGSGRITSNGAKITTSTVAYAPFGEDYNGTGAVDKTFAGMSQDIPVGTNNYMTPARSYSPQQGRWLVPDSVQAGGSAPKNFNMYIYANNSPLTNVDAEGTDACDPANYDPNNCDFIDVELWINTMLNNQGSSIYGIVDTSQIWPDALNTSSEMDAYWAQLFRDPVFANANGFVNLLGWLEIGGMTLGTGAELAGGSVVASNVVSVASANVQIYGPAILGVAGTTACGLACFNVPVAPLGVSNSPWSVPSINFAQNFAKGAASGGGGAGGAVDTARAYLALEGRWGAPYEQLVNGSHWVRESIRLAQEGGPLAADAEKMLEVWNKGKMNAAQSVYAADSQALVDHMINMGGKYADLEDFAAIGAVGRGAFAGKWPKDAAPEVMSDTEKLMKKLYKREGD